VTGAETCVVVRAGAHDDLVTALVRRPENGIDLVFGLLSGGTTISTFDRSYYRRRSAGLGAAEDSANGTLAVLMAYLCGCKRAVAGVPDHRAPEPKGVLADSYPARSGHILGMMTWVVAYMDMGIGMPGTCRGPSKMGRDEFARKAG
jgi:hypothetical protein